MLASAPVQRRGEVAERHYWRKRCPKVEVLPPTKICWLGGATGWLSSLLETWRDAELVFTPLFFQANRSVALAHIYSTGVSFPLRAVQINIEGNCGSDILIYLARSGCRWWRWRIVFHALRAAHFESEVAIASCR